MNYINGFAKTEFLQYMYSEFPDVYINSHARMLLENIVNYCTSNTFDVKNKLVSTLEILIPEIKKNEIIKFADKNTINIKDYSFEYQLLDRCKQDCEYFLGNGNKNEKFLWGKNVKDHIAKMRELYNIVPLEPEWLSMSDISNYEKLMTDTDVVTKITSLDDLKKYIEKQLDWSISDCHFSDWVGWELSQYSPAGEDFFFTIEHNNDIATAIKEICDYAYNFDQDKHIEMHIEARNNGFSGVPSTRELVEDADAIQNMLNELAEKCQRKCQRFYR